MNPHSLLHTLLAAAALALGSPAIVRAHSVWIEPDSTGTLVVRFAEPDGKLERSPGHLDSLLLPNAWSAAGGSVLTNLLVVKKADHFALTPGDPESPALAETAFVIMGTPGPNARRPLFYARWHPVHAQGARPMMTLDLVPGESPGTVRVCFRGKPLPGARAILRTPDERERELTADSEGVLHFGSGQPGWHLLTVARHREPAGGFAGGREYGITSHNASLSWIQK
ncbi:MAG: hypothetical protein KF791_20205 [Verrucomicrobiae bacterium]|nr:hypothetical protein [Verrucomicrobiae bacterium]